MVKTTRILSTSVIMLIPSLSVCQSPTPSPICNPSYIPGTFGIPQEPSPTYIPGETITLTIEPENGDFPTTPTTINWESSLGNEFEGKLTETFVFPKPGDPEIWISVGLLGPGIQPECQGWFSSAIYRARRFDITPTPFATPSPT